MAVFLCAECRIRTYEGVHQQIYSLPPLTAWVTRRARSRKISRSYCNTLRNTDSVKNVRILKDMAAIISAKKKLKPSLSKKVVPGVQKVTSFWSEFRSFAFQGNLIDLAVGLVIGTSFKELTSSLVTDIIMPPIGLLIGNSNFSDLYISLNGSNHESLAAAQEAGAPVLTYGVFLTQLIDFLLIALSVYVVLRFVLRHKLQQK